MTRLMLAIALEDRLREMCNQIVTTPQGTVFYQTFPDTILDRASKRNRDTALILKDIVRAMAQ